MPTRIEEDQRKDLIRRLKRAEEQVRGQQKTIDSGEDCEKIAPQMAAVGGRPKAAEAADLIAPLT